MSGQSLSIGVVARGSPRDELMLETLDHQGVCYEHILPGSDRKYPAVLIPDDDSSAFELASQSCENDENVIIAKKAMNLDFVLESLGGLRDEKADRYDVAVNLEEEKLMRVIGGTMASLGLPLVTKCFWPNRGTACCVLTHDVDLLTYSPFHLVVLKGSRKASSFLSLVIGGLRGTDYGWNIPEILALEEGKGVKSTFFLRTWYPNHSERVSESVELIKSGGFEVGLHASEASHLYRESLRKELERFSEIVGNRPTGVRHHILKMSVPKTWAIEDEEGLLYDATRAWNKYFGYRAGICFPYRPFSESRLRLLELPTSFMDWTALNRGTRGSGIVSTLERITRVADEYHGAMVANFHNTYLNGETFGDVVDAYKWLIDWASSSRRWVATAEECATWWNYRAAQRPIIRLGTSRKVEVSSAVPLQAQMDGKQVQVGAR